MSGCGDDPGIRNARVCPDLPQQMQRDECVLVSVFLNDPRDFESVRTSVQSAGGSIDTGEARGTSFVAVIDPTAASVLCQSPLVLAVTESIPLQPD